MTGAWKDFFVAAQHARACSHSAFVTGRLRDDGLGELELQVVGDAERRAEVERRILPWLERNAWDIRLRDADGEPAEPDPWSDAYAERVTSLLSSLLGAPEPPPTLDALLALTRTRRSDAVFEAAADDERPSLFRFSSGLVSAVRIWGPATESLVVLPSAWGVDLRLGRDVARRLVTERFEVTLDADKIVEFRAPSGDWYLSSVTENACAFVRGRPLKNRFLYEKLAKRRAELAQLEREAVASGRERFDPEVFRKLGDFGDGTDDHYRWGYYLEPRHTRMEQYAAFLNEVEPWKDTR